MDCLHTDCLKDERVSRIIEQIIYSREIVYLRFLYKCLIYCLVNCKFMQSKDVKFEILLREILKNIYHVFSTHVFKSHKYSNLKNLYPKKRAEHSLFY